MARNEMICLLTDEGIQSAAVRTSRGGRLEVPARSRVAYRVPDSLYGADDIEPLAVAIANGVQQLNVETSPVTLVIPLSWCFADVLQRPRKKEHLRTLGYALEAFLPVPLEEVNCVFAPLRNDAVIGVAVPTALMNRLLNALRLHDVVVDRMTIDVLAAHAGDESPDDAPSKGALLLDTRWCRWIAMDLESGKIPGGGSARVSFCGSSAQQIRERLIDEPLPEGGTILALSDAAVSDEVVSLLSSGADNCRILRGEEAISAVMRGALHPTTINLCVGSLEPAGRWKEVLRLARQCALGVAAVLILWTAIMHLQGQSLRRQTTLRDEARLTAYREVFAAELLPAGAALRLASERTRLEGLTKTASMSDPGKTSLLPLRVLRDAVANLPADIRLRLLDARLDEKQFTLRGRTDEHRSAERIAEAVGKVEGLSVQPPRSTRLDGGGVEFSMIATAEIHHVKE